MTTGTISKRQRARFYILKKPKQCEMFIYIYKNLDTLQKAGQFLLRFYIQKVGHFMLHDF